MAFDPDAYLKKKRTQEFDPDAYLEQTAPRTTATRARDLGRSVASAADVALNALTGTLDVAAYPLARAYYGLSMPPEQAAQRAQAETTSPKDVIGRALGITETPAYQAEAMRRGGQAIGEAVEPTIRSVSQTTGLPEQDIGSMAASLGMAAPKVVAPVAKVPIDVAKGAVGRATGRIAAPGATPEGYQMASSRIPLGNTFIEPKVWEQFQRGELPYGELPPTRPIEQLPKNIVERAAMAISPGNIPAKGERARAFGERIGETYRNPLQAAVDVGSLFTTGVPFMTAARLPLAAAQGAADWLLGRKGFDPKLPETLAKYTSNEIPMPGTPPSNIKSAVQEIAASKITPAPGPVAPQPIPTQVAPTIAEINQQIQGLGLSAEGSKKALIDTLVPQIIKESKAKGIVVDKANAKMIATKRADDYLKQQQVIRNQQLQTKKEAERQAYQNSPEYQARRADLDTRMQDPEFARLANQNLTGMNRNKTRYQLALDDPDEFSNLVNEVEKLKETRAITAETAARNEKSKLIEEIRTRGKQPKPVEQPNPVEQPKPVEQFKPKTSSLDDDLFGVPDPFAGINKKPAPPQQTAIEFPNEYLELRKRIVGDKPIEPKKIKPLEFSSDLPEYIPKSPDEIRLERNMTPQQRNLELARQAQMSGITKEKSEKTGPIRKSKDDPVIPANEFNVRDWVSTTKKGGVRRLTSTVLRDIEFQTGVKIEPKHIEDISKLKPNQIKTAVTRAFKKAAKEQGKL